MRAALCAVVVAGTFALSAQQNCLPPANPRLQWAGQSSGCTRENGVPCAVGETIVFSVRPSYPGCVKYLWSFDDGDTSTAASPSHLYVTDGTFVVSVTVTGGDTSKSDGDAVVVVTTVQARVERFSASARFIRQGQTVILSWATTNASTVLIEPINVTRNATPPSFEFAPDMTRTYTLTAFGDAALSRSSPSKSVTVTVIPSTARRRVVRH